MTYRKPKGPGTIHGWSTTATQAGYYRQHDAGDGYVYGARLVYWAVLVIVLLAVFSRGSL